MAAVALLGAATFDTASGTKTVTAAPTVGDLIVIISAHTGNTSAATPTDNNPGGAGTYTRINSSVKAASVDTLAIYIRTALITNAGSTVFTHAPGASTGGGIVVLRVTGMSKVGTAAARQSAVQSNQAAAGTPTPVLGVAALTTNALIGAVFSATNSTTTQTPRASPAYAERFDNGYNTPPTGLEVMSIDSGETGTSIAWGGASASAFCDVILELDTRPHTEEQARFRFYEDSTEAHANAIVKDSAGLRCMVSGKFAGIYASTPDSVAVSVTGDIDFRCKVFTPTWTPGADIPACAKRNAGNSFQFYLQTTGNLAFYSGGTGVVASTATVQSVLNNGTTTWLRWTRNATTGDVAFYTSWDGTSWTQLGTTVSGAAGALADTADALEIGGTVAGTVSWAGIIYYAELLNGIGGSTAAKFDPNTDAADAATSFTASSGETWTLNGTQDIAAQSTNIGRTVQAAGVTQLLLRVGLQETAAVDGAATDDYQLQVSKNSGAFADVTTSSSNVKAINSVALTDGNTTASRLTGGTGSFVAGEISEDGLVDDRQLTASNNTEHLFTIAVVGADVADADTLDFRVLRNSLGITYTVTPRITVVRVTPTAPPATFNAGAASRGVAIGVGVF